MRARVGSQFLKVIESLIMVILGYQVGFYPVLVSFAYSYFCKSGEFADVYKGILKTREGKKIVAMKVLRVN